VSRVGAGRVRNGRGRWGAGGWEEERRFGVRGGVEQGGGGRGVEVG